MEALHGILSTFTLVWDHTANCTPENLSGCTKVEGSTEGFYVTPKAQELQVLQLVTVEITTHVDALTSDDNNLVATEDEFGDR